jgi:hypothetical protein
MRRPVERGQENAIMTRRMLACLSATAVVLTLAVMTRTATAQSSPTAAPSHGAAGWSLERHLDLVRTLREHTGVSPAWKPKRTAWGHPDFEGAWTSDAVHGVPRERPAAFGHRMFLNDAELAERVSRETKTREDALTASGAGTAGRDRAWRGDITFRLTSLVVDPPDGRTPRATPEAEKRRANRDRGSFGAGPFDTPEDFTLYDRCITRGIVGSILPVVYGNGNRILQTPESLVFSYEMIHDTRVIPTDGRPALDSQIRQLLGDSRGRWEGDTLVVETTNFTDRTSIGANGNGLRHSAAMRMVEHFTRVSDDVILYDVTVDDPKTYERPFTIAIPLISPPGFQPLPYECHEGNGAVKYAMSGARKFEEAVADAKAKGLPPPEPSSSVHEDVAR